MTSALSVAARAALVLLAFTGGCTTPRPDVGRPAPAPAQATAPPVEYEISFPAAGTHEAQVVATFRGLAPDRPLQVRMSRSSPGRYAEHGFAKNVYAVSATDDEGRALAISRPDQHGWTVSGHQGTVRFRYTVWGDRIDGTYLGVDATHAHMNMPATFVWARGLEERPVRLRIRAPERWRVVTQLRPAGAGSYTAPDLQYFLDSPTEVGPVELRTWPESYRGRTATYQLAVHHLGAPHEVDSLAAMTRQVIAEQHAIWGEMPAYDFGEYTFIVDQLPWANGDGMEHRNSTIVSGNYPIATRQQRLTRLGTISHELFHAWNVERLRPRSLEPFDFERANQSGELWFAEGFTSYYGPLSIRRAGLYSNEDYARMLGNTLITVIQSPARAYGSPVEMSQRAPFVDAATSIDPVHHHNTFLSYYTWGAAIGLGLDLTLRTHFDRTLDEWMQALWQEFGRHQTAALTPARPYTMNDLRTSLGRLTGDTAFAADFFRRYIEGREVPDYAALLAPAGFLLVTDSVVPYLGASLDSDTAGVFVNWTAANGPLFPLGINNGDVIIAVEGRTMTDADELRAYIAARQPDDAVRLAVRGRDGLRQVVVTLGQRGMLRLVTFESAGRPVSPDVRAFRESWLGSRAGR